MSNTFFGVGSSSLAELVAAVERGYLLTHPSNGMEDPKGWGIQLEGSMAEEIRAGRLTGRVFSPVVVTGSVPRLLQSVSGVGHELVEASLGSEPISVTIEGTEFTLLPSQVGFDLDEEALVEEALAQGRGGGFLSELKWWLTNLVGGALDGVARPAGPRRPPGRGLVHPDPHRWRQRSAPPPGCRDHHRAGGPQSAVEPAGPGSARGRGGLAWGRGRQRRLRPRRHRRQDGGGHGLPRRSDGDPESGWGPGQPHRRLRRCGRGGAVDQAVDPGAVRLGDRPPAGQPPGPRSGRAADALLCRVRAPASAGRGRRGERVLRPRRGRRPRGPAACQPGRRGRRLPARGRQRRAAAGRHPAGGGVWRVSGRADGLVCRARRCRPACAQGRRPGPGRAGADPAQWRPPAPGQRRHRTQPGRLPLRRARLCRLPPGPGARRCAGRPAWQRPLDADPGQAAPGPACDPGRTGGKPAPGRAVRRRPGGGPLQRVPAPPRHRRLQWRDPLRLVARA